MSSEKMAAVRLSDVTEAQLFPGGAQRIMLVQPQGDGQARAYVVEPARGAVMYVVEGDLVEMVRLAERRRGWFTITTSVGTGPKPPNPPGDPHGEPRKLLLEGEHLAAKINDYQVAAAQFAGFANET